MAAQEGKIVEFLDGERLKIGLVTASNPGKVRVTDRGGKQHKVLEKHVVVVHSESASLRELADRATEIDDAVVELVDEVDTELLWDGLERTGGTEGLRLSSLAEEYFGDAGGVHESAIFRALCEDDLRFRRRGRAVFARSREEVESHVNAQRNREEKERRRVLAIATLRTILREPGAIDFGAADVQDLVRRVESWVWEPAARQDDVADWLQRAAGNLGPDEAAYEVLKASGRIPESSDRFLISAGLKEAFPQEVIDAVEALVPFEDRSERVDFTGALSFTIDDEDTTEIDDAITVERLAGDVVRTRVAIHIADVATFVEPGGALDREAARRGVTIYLPSRCVTMFPHRLSCDLASLREGELRPVMSFVVELDGTSGEILESSVVRGLVRVRHRLDYQSADALIDSDDGGDLARSLRELALFAQRRLSARRACGALTIRRPELRVRAREGEEVQVEILNDASSSRMIVSELMILANAIGAEEAWRREVPMIFRTQDPPHDPVDVPGEYDPVRLEAVFRSLEKSQFSTHPRPHSGLGLEAYARMTSPIRRFADLVLQRQLTAHLRGTGELPYGTEQLLEVLAAAQDVETSARSVESRATRFHVLEYIAQRRRGHEFDAIVMRRQGAGAIVEIDELFVRGRLASARKLEVGDRVRVRIEKVDARRDALVFAAVDRSRD